MSEKLGLIPTPTSTSTVTPRPDPQADPDPQPSQPLGTILVTYRGHSKAVWTGAWSPDDKRIVSGAVFLDHTAQVRDATTGYNTYIYHGYSAQINVLAWSPDGTRIALAGLDGIVQVWQAK